MSECKICGQDNCKKHALSIGKVKSITDFSGSSPPEVFVGRWNYPNVYAGILSPQEYGDTEEMSSAEQWHKRKLSIPEVIKLRNKLIYGRSKTQIKNPKQRFISVLKEVAMTHKSVATEFSLEKPIAPNSEKETRVPLISNAANIHNVKLQENPKVHKKVDYLVNDVDAKAQTALKELESTTSTSTMIKLLSAGLLGKKEKRKLVPTRWSITAVDSNLSKDKLTKIRFYKELSEISLFHAEYLGNHYEFLLLPEKFAFEVIEISHKGGFWKDYESFKGRNNYAESVTGAYYANRLALTEYLERIKRQAQCLVLREIKPEYSAPLGVGILRQISRDAFSKIPEKFNTIKEALDKAQKRMKTPIKNYTERSELLAEFKKQTRLSSFFKKF